jgi:hypothetical protein
LAKGGKKTTVLFTTTTSKAMMREATTLNRRLNKKLRGKEIEAVGFLDLHDARKMGYTKRPFCIQLNNGDRLIFFQSQPDGDVLLDEGDGAFVFGRIEM